MNKFNFLEKTNVTYIIIGIFILFALIHLYKINSNTTEPFAAISENSNVNYGVTIDIPLLSQIRFGSGSTMKGMDTLFTEKADKGLVETLNNTVYGTGTGTGLINTLATTTTKANDAFTAANNAMPELSIVAYAGSNNLPSGWQLCDGLSLKYYDNITKTNGYNVTVTFPVNPIFTNLQKKISTETSMNEYLTPDLRGRFILGTNSLAIPSTNTTIPNAISVRNINDVGGVEKHKLIEPEMPSHDHALYANGTSVAYGRQGTGSGTGDYSARSASAGGNQPHENMPPFYVLTYIIKQPIKV